MFELYNDIYSNFIIDIDLDREFHLIFNKLYIMNNIFDINNFLLWLFGYGIFNFKDILLDTYKHLLAYDNLIPQYLKIVKILFKNININPFDNGFIIEQIFHNRYNKIIKLLLKDTRIDYDIMILSASQWGYPKIVKLLLKHKEINFSINDNWALKIAVINNNYKIVKLLLKDGRSNPTIENNYIIQYAFKHKFYKIIKLLLNDKRINPNI